MLPAILKLWLNRLIWFVVVVVGLTILLHLPAGIRYHETGQQVEGLRVVKTYSRSYSFDRVVDELRRYPAQVLAGEVIFREGPQAPGYNFLPILRHDWINSFKLYALGVGAGVALGLLLGSMVALRRRFLRSFSFSVSILSLSLPDFFVVLTLQFISIWVWLHFDMKPFLVLADPNIFPKGWLVPLIGMALVPMGYMARLTATALDDVLREDYIRTARSKGLHEGHVILGHAFRNAMPRVLAGMPALLNVTLSSLPVVERFTVWPGISKWLVVRAGMTTEQLFGITPAIASTAAILLVAWFVLFDGAAHTARIIYSPKQPEVARA